MAYFEPYIDAEGIHIPTYDDRMEKLQEEYKRIFGEDIYLGAETPDYQLLSVFAKSLDDMAAFAVQCYNARDPYLAVGDSLDIIMPLVGMYRRSATHSTAILTLSGTAGTVIAAGSQAIDQAGYIWTIQDEVTIPEEEEIDVKAVCETAGAISAGVGTIDGIYTPTAGWNDVINATEAVVGKNVETDAEFRYRHSQSHVKRNNGMTEAFIAKLLEIPDVSFATLAENKTNQTDARGIPGHSICAIVTGGDDMEVAETVYRAKAPGVGTFGNTSCTVDDGAGGTTTVQFSRTVEQPVSVTVTVRTTSGWSEDFSDRIKSALMADINALGIGKSWMVSMGYKDIYSAFEAYGYPFSVTSISATNAHGTSSVEAECYYNESLTVSEEDISIVVET